MSVKLMMDSFQKRDFGFIGLISILILSFIIGTIAFKSRQDQWSVWSLNKNITFFNDSPLLSTADGPYFIDIANRINKNEPISSHTEKRFFPEFDNISRKKINLQKISEPNFFQVSLLPISIAFLSKFNENDLLLTANQIIPYTAFLTSLSIAFLFIVMGFGFEGAVCGLGASLSQSILVRTSIGRVDTDLLNIGFFYAILALIFASIRSNDIKLKLVFISLCGFINFLFTWWYQHPGFFFPFFITIVLLQFLYKINLKTSIIQITLFSIFSGPLYVIKSFESITTFTKEFLNFSTKETVQNGLIFPDTFNTITELQRLDFIKYFELSFGNGNEWIGFLGISGLIIFVFLNFKKSVVLLPAFIFLLMSIFVGKRFAIYAIPLYWFGLSYLILSLILFIQKSLLLRFFKNDFIKIFTPTTVSVILIFIAFSTSISACENSLFFNCKPKYVPQPSFSPKITESFYSLRSKDFDPTSIVITWWDYGYWLNYFSNLRTVHDGGSQRSPKTYLVANSLTSSSQLDSYNKLNYIVSSNLEKVINDSNKGYEFFNQEISKSKSIDHSTYLFLTRDMIRWWSTITYLGNWDIINGLEKNKAIFERIDCKPKSQVEMICGKAVLNVNTGSISNGNQLDNLIITQDGELIRNYNYKSKKGMVSLLIEIIGNKKYFYVIDSKTLKSTFSNLFFLNKTNNSYFKLVKDGYPLYRVFKIKK